MFTLSFIGGFCLLLREIDISIIYFYLVSNLIFFYLIYFYKYKNNLIYSSNTLKIRVDLRRVFRIGCLNIYQSGLVIYILKGIVLKLTSSI